MKYSSLMIAVGVALLTSASQAAAPTGQSGASVGAANNLSLPVRPAAVDVSIFGIGPPVDALAVRQVRRAVGASISNGVTDKFFIRGYGIEGGFSACAQKSPFATATDFGAFIERLRAIKPNSDTTSYSVEPRTSCDEPVFCTAEAKMCPDGSFVPRKPPTCEFAPCPNP